MASISSLLVANRGEIAVRILRTARELGIRGVAVFSPDDAQSLHVRQGDDAIELPGAGPAAYLDAGALVAAAQRARCDAVHPGYGFLSENADFARQCAEAGITFVGPRPEVLDLFGDKVAARALAGQAGVPVLAGTAGAVTLDQAAAFLESLGPGGAVMLKAVAGGGGRGMREVRAPQDLAAAYERCQSEALRAFGDGAVFAEELVPRARHIEVQVIGDGAGGLTHLGERECSLQRRHQKLVEITPAPRLPPGLAGQLCDAAVTLAGAAGYDNVGTFEFLVDAGRQTFAFIEANPRLQVEHTVTEEVTGVDLVATQLSIAAGATLAGLGLDARPGAAPRGMALQVRVNTETIGRDGAVLPAAGTLTAFDLPSGPGIRVDTSGYAGYPTNPRFDSLLAKVIAWTPRSDLGEVIRRASRALREFRVEGVATNIPFLEALLADPAVAAGDLYTGLVGEHLDDLLAPAGQPGARLYFEGAPVPAAGLQAAGRAGAQVDQVDPLAVLIHGKTPARDGSGAPAWSPDGPAGPPAGGLAVVPSPLQGTVVSVDVAPGARVGAGQQLLVMEAMKMEHVVSAPVSGIVAAVGVAPGDTLVAGHPIVTIEPDESAAAGAAAAEQIDLEAIRPDLAAVLDRHDLGLDHRRPEAVATRRATGQRTARENIDDLVDPGSFVEYGPLTIAAQRARRSTEDLIANTPADGLPSGFGTVNGELFGQEQGRVAVVAYDYTVLAGTQGVMNHIKKDRMFELAEQARTPLVLFAEGGGGRSGDTDAAVRRRNLAFYRMARLSGLIPLVGIASGRCFAGNACLLSCCDVVIATADSTIGMGGPAMIEGGGLGVFRPEEVGPMSVQVPNGVVDLPVADEAEAVAVARRYLSYFQGALPDWACADQRELRWVVPENRLRAYDVRRAIDLLADTGSVLEIRKHFGVGVVTALARVEGRPLGIIANNPMHLGGALDSDGADKATRFMQLCDAFGLPVLNLCDTPGIMVGPEAEKTALVRHAGRMFVTGANLSVPVFTIVLRKAYGLGAPAMAGGSLSAPFFLASWPTGEFFGMGIEGSVKLGFRKELAAISDPARRRERFDELVATRYESARAINQSTTFHIDDVIDPADSRRWVVLAMDVAHGQEQHPAKRRPNIDAW